MREEIYAHEFRNLVSALRPALPELEAKDAHEKGLAHGVRDDDDDIALQKP
jgi:hypothetical protein